VREDGLADRVEYVEDDYRYVTGRYDVFVSIGMLEHVGLPDYPTLGRVIDRSLLPSGRGLLLFIGRNRPAPLNAWIRKRIFPGAYPPTLREVRARFGDAYDRYASGEVGSRRFSLTRAVRNREYRGDRADDGPGVAGVARESACLNLSCTL
jgi:cyclopropane fatty-acyl-phospholipid synthase-like methyltransferase